MHSIFLWLIIIFHLKTIYHIKKLKSKKTFIFSYIGAKVYSQEIRFCLSILYYILANSLGAQRHDNNKWATWQLWRAVYIVN